MKYIQQALIVAVMAVVGIIALPTTSYANSLGTSTVCSGSNASSVVCQNSAGGEAKVNSLIKTIINTLLFITGIIAVIMIIVGGIRYTTSNGDAGSVAGAKNTILYSVVGLVVAIFAWAIVNFVANQVTGGQSGAGQNQQGQQNQSTSSNTSSDGADSNGIVP